MIKKEESMSDLNRTGMEQEDRGDAKNAVLWKDRKHFMWFPFSFTKYEVRNSRLYTQKGLLRTTYDEVLLYRILDITMTQTLGQKIFGTGTLLVCAKANRDGDVLLENVKRPRMVNDMLSELVEKARDKKRVVGKEFYSSDGHTAHEPDVDDDLYEPED